MVCELNCTIWNLLLVFLIFLYASVQLTSGCTDGTLRLAGGQSTTEGRVEICINRVWGSVCHNNWDSSDARVACRQLGLPYDAGAIIEYLSIFVEQWLN